MPRRKTKKKAVKRHIPAVLMTVGIFFMALSLLHWYFKWQALSLNQEIIAQHTSSQKEETEKLPVHISIPWFIDVSISPQVLVSNTWTIAEKEASYLSQSAKPGENGNIIIYGHNTRQILGNIRALKGGEIITLTSANGEKHQYQVTKTVEVNPDQTEYLLPTAEEILTLYTCSGFMDQKRFIVVAKPVPL